MNCTCNDNPNCFWCDGTGIRRITSRHATPGSNKKLEPGNKLPATNHLSLNDFLKLNRPKDDKHSNSPKSGPVWSICLACRAIVKTGNLAKHQKNCPAKRQAYKTNLQSPNSIQCPHCRAFIKTSRFKEHVEWKCSKNLGNGRHTGLSSPYGKRKKQKASGLDRNNFGHTTDKYSSYFNAYKSEPKLDMSKGFHVRRENGRFGSFSSSDDYGEEAFF